jgi:YD repeat-containing protein
VTTAAHADDLYRAQTIVTGQGEPNRTIGFSVCLEDVLIKVSGALKLAGDPRLAPLKAHASDFVAGFSYHDQMSGTPKRDEQGTRDRPYDLIVDFDKARIDDALASLGVRPWPPPRPLVGVFVAMVQGGRSYIVTADGRQSELQRDALRAAADRRGIAIALPEAAAVMKASVDASQIITMPSADLAAMLPDPEVTLVGRLSWDDDALGWTTEWRLDGQGKPRSQSWRLGGVTFDEAFRRGLGGAAQILSGNGVPE